MQTVDGGLKIVWCERIEWCKETCACCGKVQKDRWWSRMCTPSPDWEGWYILLSTCPCWLAIMGLPSWVSLSWIFATADFCRTCVTHSIVLYCFRSGIRSYFFPFWRDCVIFTRHFSARFFLLRKLARRLCRIFARIFLSEEVSKKIVSYFCAYLSFWRG